jgi:hypothetical protein
MDGEMMRSAVCLLAAMLSLVVLLVVSEAAGAQERPAQQASAPADCRSQA